MAHRTTETAGSRSPSAFKLFLMVLILLHMATTMEQLSMHEDTVRGALADLRT